MEAKSAARERFDSVRDGLIELSHRVGEPLRSLSVPRPSRRPVLPRMSVMRASRHLPRGHCSRSMPPVHR